MLDSINSETQTAPDVTRNLERLREATGQVVGNLFFGEMFKSMRENPFRGEYGHGGRGEEIFAAQLHGILAERIGTTVSGGLGDALYEALKPQQERMGVLNTLG